MSDIFCEVVYKPEGWDWGWIGDSSAKVHWEPTENPPVDPSGSLEIIQLPFDGRYAVTGYVKEADVVVIPDGVTYIWDNVFEGCSSLTSIKIPDSVTYIGSYAFYNCSSLESIRIPDSVTSMGERVFDNSDNLKNIYCEAKSQPEGWTPNWNEGVNAEITWGSSGA